MESLCLDATPDTPQVKFNKQEKIFELSGRSLPEDSVDFYKPVMEWVKNYSQQPNDTTDFVFKLEYYNTASSKMILDLIMLMKPIPGIKIVWYYYEEDESQEEAGRELAEQIKIPFEFRTM